MYGKGNAQNFEDSRYEEERRPIMKPVDRNNHQSQNRRNHNNDVIGAPHYNTPRQNLYPLASLRNEDGGYVGPAGLDHVNPDSPDRPSPSQHRLNSPSHLHSSNSVPINPAYDGRGKGNPQSIGGSVDVDTSSYQSERQRGDAAGTLACQDRTGCEKILLMGAALLLIIILTLATGIVVLQGYGGVVVDGANTCQSRECIKAAGNILGSLDESVEPCDDFVQFACGGWEDNHPIPEASFRWSMLDILDENTLYEVKNLLEERPTEEEPISVTAARKFYQACVDDRRWSEVGLTPLLALLEEAGGLPMIDPEWQPEQFHLEEVLAWNRRAGGQTLVTLSVSPDMVNNSQNAINLLQGILPSQIGVLKNATEETKKTHISFMKRTVNTLLTAKGLGDNDTLKEVIAKDVEEMWQLSVDLAQISGNDQSYRSPWSSYNPMTVNEFSNITNHQDIPFKIDWLQYFERTFNETDISIDGDYRIIVQSPTYFQNLTTLLSGTKTRTIANFLLYQMVHAMAEETSSSLRNMFESLDNSIWSFGRLSVRPWHDCARKTRILLQIPLGHLYFKKNSIEDVKGIAKKLVSDVANAFRSMLTSATWMSNSTSKEAIMKVDNMIQLVAYPDFLLDNEKLDEYMSGLPEVSTTDHFGNIMALSRWHGHRSLASLNSSPSRSKWPAGAIEINAFYSALQNAIVIPGAVLQPPLFHHEDMAALNYGGIGAIVGHEITHGFDVLGRNFDSQGRLANWWDNNTMNLYINRSKCFEDQYSSYNVSELLSPFEGVDEELKIDGVLSKGENVADNGGVRAAWLAYKNHIKETEEELILPGLQKYTQDQLFFITFSRVWCMQYTPWALKYSLASDQHPPGHYRTLGALQNTKEFSETFNCAKGSQLNPEKKCVLW